MSREPATISASSQSRLVCRGAQVRDASRYTVPSTNLATRLVESDSIQVACLLTNERHQLVAGLGADLRRFNNAGSQRANGSLYQTSHAQLPHRLQFGHRLRIGRHRLISLFLYYLKTCKARLDVVASLLAILSIRHVPIHELNLLGFGQTTKKVVRRLRHHRSLLGQRRGPGSKWIPSPLLLYLPGT